MADLLRLGVRNTDVPKDELQRNLIAAQPRPYWLKDTAIALVPSIDDAEQKYGAGVYDEMMTDPTVQGVVNGLVSKVVQTSPALVPAYVLSPYHPSTEVERDKALFASRVADFAKASLSRLARRGMSVPAVMREMVESAVVHGHGLAEVVFETVESGPYAGRLIHSTIQTKPRDNYVYVVDSGNRLLGVQAIVPGVNFALLHGPVPVNEVAKLPGFVPASKLFHFAFWPRHGSPVGRSLLRGAFRPWQKRKLGDPEDVKTAVAFGGGMLTVSSEIGTRSSEAQQKELSSNLAKLANSGTLVLPPGYAFSRHDPPPHDYFEGYLHRCRTDIAEAIVGSARAFVESKNGSRADSHNAVEWTDIVSSVIAMTFAEAFEAQVVFPLVALNFGDAAAEEFCPKVLLNEPSTNDIPGLATAASSLAAGGLLPTTMHRQVVEKWFGLEWQDEASVFEGP